MLRQFDRVSITNVTNLVGIIRQSAKTFIVYLSSMLWFSLNLNQEITSDIATYIIIMLVSIPQELGEAISMALEKDLLDWRYRF
jgi:hypothetical protein